MKDRGGKTFDAFNVVAEYPPVFRSVFFSCQNIQTMTEPEGPGFQFRRRCIAVYVQPATGRSPKGSDSRPPSTLAAREQSEADPVYQINNIVCFNRLSAIPNKNLDLFLDFVVPDIESQSVDGIFVPLACIHLGGLAVYDRRQSVISNPGIQVQHNLAFPNQLFPKTYFFRNISPAKHDFC